MLPLWEGITQVHSKDGRGMTPDKVGRFCTELNNHLVPTLTSSLQKAILHGPVGMDSEVNDGEYAGVFLKRVQKWLWKTHELQFDDKKNILNDIYTNIQSNEVKYDMWGQLVPKMHWNPGDFGDSGSCLWGGNQIHRYKCSNWEQFRGLILFKESRKVRDREADEKQCQESWHNAIYEDRLLSGVGRAICAVDFPEPGCFAAYNAYGVSLEACVSAFIEGIRSVDPTYAESLQVRTDLKHKSGSTLYVNSSKIHVVGPPEIVSKLKDVGHTHVKSDWPDFEEYLGNCSYCNSKGVYSDRKHFRHGKFQLCQACLGNAKYSISNCPCGTEIVVADGPNNHGLQGIARVYVDDDMKKVHICENCFDMDVPPWLQDDRQRYVDVAPARRELELV